MRTLLRAIIAGTLGAVTAGVAALALGNGYREGELAAALLGLALPPLGMIALYEGTAKRASFALGSVLISATLLDAVASFGVPWGGFTLFLISMIALCAPVALDLVSVDLGKQIRPARGAVQVMSLVFALSVLPFSGWALFSAHSDIVAEDAELIGQLASRLSNEGDTLVVDHLDSKLRERAQRRVAIRSNGKTYDLSDADVESVVEERTVRKKTKKRGVDAAETVSQEQEERMRLILNLQGMGIPDDVVVYSRRGPLTIYEAKVPLSNHGS